MAPGATSLAFAGRGMDGPPVEAGGEFGGAEVPAGCPRGEVLPKVLGEAGGGLLGRPAEGDPGEDYPF
jgi:hypothetical protein